MQNIWIIGGGVPRENVTNTHFLKNHIELIEENRWDPFSECAKNWKDSLQETLGENYRVFKLPMNKTLGCDYAEWSITMEDYENYASNQDILIGHSLGGSFILKYYSENPDKYLGQKIILVAPAFISDEGEWLGSFWPENIVEYPANKTTTLFFSDDDPIVPKENIIEAKDYFDIEDIILLRNRGHFLDKNFPEIINEIREK